jgi:hypothetical protein
MSWRSYGVFTISGLEFQLVCRLNLQRGPDGHIAEFTPHVSFSNPRGLPLVECGAGPFCRFSIPKLWRGRAGVYAFLIEGTVAYVGECEDLERRMNQGYGNISPRNCFVGGQPTNCRVNLLILNAVKERQTVDLGFHETKDRLRIERVVLAELSPPWNRQGSNRSVLSKRVESPDTPLDAHPNPPATSCRSEILEAVRAIIEASGRNEFSVEDVITYLRHRGTRYADATLRTHITSRCCKNAPNHHAVTYPDFERVARGRYRFLDDTSQ